MCSVKEKSNFVWKMEQHLYVVHFTWHCVKHVCISCTACVTRDTCLQCRCRSMCLWMLAESTLCHTLCGEPHAINIVCFFGVKYNFQHHLCCHWFCTKVTQACSAASPQHCITGAQQQPRVDYGSQALGSLGLLCCAGCKALFARHP